MFNKIFNLVFKLKKKKDGPIYKYFKLQSNIKIF